MTASSARAYSTQRVSASRVTMAPAGQRRLEVVLRGAGEIHDARVASTRVRAPSAPGDHVAVGVHRVDRIHQGDHAVRGEDLLEVRTVALAAVAHEDLVDTERDAPGAEVVRGDLGAQEFVSDVRALALE